MNVMKSKFVWAMMGWLDSWRYQEKLLANGESMDGDKVEWFRCIPFILLHLMCLCVIWVGISPIAVAVAVALYFIRMFAITGFYHRYFSHRAFSTSRWFQFVMAVLGNSSAQRGPLWWAAHHRHHHRHSDQEEDVHSPHHHSLLWSHMLWITTRSNFPTELKNVPDLAKYPELCWLDRFDILVPFLLGISMFSVGEILRIFAPGLGTTGFQMLIWGFFISTVVVFHCTCFINSLAHLFGGKRYETKDESRNNFFLALLTMGEGWHNNHHYYPASVRQGFYWWEVDMTYYILRILDKIGLIWNLKPVPVNILERGRKPRHRR